MKKIDRIILLSIGACFALFYFFAQPVITMEEGRIWDAGEYCTMAEQYAAGKVASVDKPFVYRIGFPLLVSIFGDSNVLFVFKIFNYIFSLLILYVVLDFLALFFKERIIIYLVYFIFIFSINVPIRFTAFYPAYVDPPFMLISLLVLYYYYKWETLTPAKTVLLCVLTFIGILFREVTILAPLTGIFAHKIRIFDKGKLIHVPSFKQLFIAILPILAAIAAIIVTHVVVKPTGDYTFSSHALISIKTKLKNPLIYFLAVCNAFGPIILLLLFLKKEAFKQIVKHHMLLFYWLGICVLAILGGTHTERFFFWGFISLLVIFGWIIRDLSGENKIILIILIISFAVLQLIGTRAFLTIPDIDKIRGIGNPAHFFLAPFGENTHYYHIWTYYMKPALRSKLFYQYCALALYFIVLRVVLFILNRLKNKGLFK